MKIHSLVCLNLYNIVEFDILKPALRRTSDMIIQGVPPMPIVEDIEKSWL